MRPAQQSLTGLGKNNLLADIRPYAHSVGHSYRSHVPIEPWLSSQWYVAVTDDKLRGSALRAQDTDQSPALPEDVEDRSDQNGDGGLTFFPRSVCQYLLCLA